MKPNNINNSCEDPTFPKLQYPFVWRFVIIPNAIGIE